MLTLRRDGIQLDASATIKQSVIHQEVAQLRTAQPFTTLAMNAPAALQKIRQAIADDLSVEAVE